MKIYRFIVAGLIGVLLGGSRVDAAAPPTISRILFVNWRTGLGYPLDWTGKDLTFSYLNQGSGLPVPSRAGPADNSANNQGCLWSDNAIYMEFSWPTADRDPGWAILIYTDNQANGPSDPLGTLTLRGGLVGGAGSGNPNDPGRSSVLPLIWKYVANPSDVNSASYAKIDGSVKIPTGNSLFMPTEITYSNGGHCDAEGPYGASDRTTSGFCDYSTHYVLDKNNTDPAHLFFTGYGYGDPNRLGAFKYTALVTSTGVSSSEGGGPFGGGPNFPAGAYYVLGVKASETLSTQYATTINIEVAAY